MRQAAGKPAHMMLLFACLLFALSAACPTGALASDASAYVRDEAGILTTSTIQDINDLNAQWEAEGKTTRLKVVTLRSLDKPIEQTARDLFVSNELDGDDLLYVYSTTFGSPEYLLVGDDMKTVISDDMIPRLIYDPSEDATSDDTVSYAVRNIRDAVEVGDAVKYREREDRNTAASTTVLLYALLFAAVWFGTVMVQSTRREILRDWRDGRLLGGGPLVDSIGRMGKRRRAKLSNMGYTSREIDYIDQRTMELLDWVIIMTIPTILGFALIPLALKGGFSPTLITVCALLVAAPVLFWNVRVHCLQWPLPASRRAEISERRQFAELNRKLQDTSGLHDTGLTATLHFQPTKGNMATPVITGHLYADDTRITLLDSNGDWLANIRRYDDTGNNSIRSIQVDGKQLSVAELCRLLNMPDPAEMI